MRKIIGFLLLFCQLETYACDMCGCANSGSFFGVLPQSHRQFIGLKYKTKEFDSHLGSTLLKTKEQYQTTELWGRFYPFKKTQVLFFVPYNFNRQTTLSGRTAQIDGLGDASVLMHYNLRNTFWDSTIHRFYQNFLIGGGVKFPTGKYHYEADKIEGANPNFQLGTGSLDFIINAIYTIRYLGWGVNTDLTYKINTKNSNNYRFANRVNSSLTAFYTHKFGKFTMMPHLGSMAEFTNKDTKNGIKNTYTGGWLITGNIGIETFYKNLSLGLIYQKPMAQNLVNKELKLNRQASIHLMVMF